MVLESGRVYQSLPSRLRSFATSPRRFLPRQRLLPPTAVRVLAILAVGDPPRDCWGLCGSTIAVPVRGIHGAGCLLLPDMEEAPTGTRPRSWQYLSVSGLRHCRVSL